MIFCWPILAEITAVDTARLRADCADTVMTQTQLTDQEVKLDVHVFAETTRVVIPQRLRVAERLTSTTPIITQGITPYNANNL